MHFDREGKPYAGTGGPCTWCGALGPFRARDHIFPRSLGATRELAVPSCPGCDDKIKNVEGRIARSSIFALRRLVAGPPPRKPEDQASGSLEAYYSFAPDPDGGFNDVRMRGGDLPPVTLPSFQFDVKNAIGHRRYSTPEDYGRLEAVLLTADSATETDPLDVNVRILHEGDPLHDHPKFFPRVSLGLNGELVATARNYEEVEIVVKCAIFAAKHPDKLTPTEPRMWEVPGGTPHTAMIVMNENDAFRVVSKIAVGVATCILGGDVIRTPTVDTVRAFVRDGPTSENSRSPAVQVLPGKELEGFPDHHLAIVERADGEVRVVVVVSGYCYEVRLGRIAGDDLVKGAVSWRNGTETFLISAREAAEIQRAITRARKAGSLRAGSLDS